MRDISLLFITLALAWLAWMRPWWGVIGLAFLGGMHPQGYATGFMQSVPVYLVLFAVTLTATLRDFAVGKVRPVIARDWRVLTLILLWGHFLLTTMLAFNPWAAWPRMIEVAKVLPPLVLALILLDDREKLRAWNIMMAATVALVAFKGGLWAILTGFSERVYGPPGSPYEGNNEFAVATAMMIPLLFLWLGETRARPLRLGISALVALCFISALTSWSRGGLLSLLVVAGLLIWHFRRRWAALPLLAAGMGLVLVLLPEGWFMRMESMGAPSLDASAQNRLDVWRLGGTYALQHPWQGGGFGGWIYLSLPTGSLLDWHSAYVQIMAEHGLPGLALWGALLLGSLFSLTRLIAVCQRSNQSLAANHAAMLRASLAAYTVGAAFLGIAYWDLLFMLIVSAILIRHVTGRPIESDGQPTNRYLRREGVEHPDG